MHVRDDGGDRSSLTPRQFGAPCSGVEMLQDDLIHPLIYCVALDHYLARIEATVSL